MDELDRATIAYLGEGYKELFEFVPVQLAIVAW